jgi:hypothetical protein
MSVIEICPLASSIRPRRPDGFMTERDTSSNAACAITVLRVPVGRAAGSVGTPMDRSVAPGSPRERCRRRVARGVRACRRTPHGGGWLPRPFRSDRGAWAHAEARRSSAPRAVTPSSPPVTHRRGHNSGPLPVVPVLIRRHRPERLDNPCLRSSATWCPRSRRPASACLLGESLLLVVARLLLGGESVRIHSDAGEQQHLDQRVVALRRACEPPAAGQDPLLPAHDGPRHTGG